MKLSKNKVYLVEKTKLNTNDCGKDLKSVIFPNLQELVIQSLEHIQKVHRKVKIMA